MFKPTKLYDFSIRSAILVILAYLCLIAILAGACAGMANPVPYLLMIVALMLSFVALYWYFVGFALVLDQNEVRRGKKSIARKHAAVTVFYNQRYREMTIEIADARRRGTTDKHGKPYAFTVQATKQNIRKTEAWLGKPLEIPEKTKNGK